MGEDHGKEKKKASDAHKASKSRMSVSGGATPTTSPASGEHFKNQVIRAERGGFFCGFFDFAPIKETKHSETWPNQNKIKQDEISTARDPNGGAPTVPASEASAALGDSSNSRPV